MYIKMEPVPVTETPARHYHCKYDTEEERYAAHKKAAREYYHRVKPTAKPKPAVSSYTKEYRNQYYKDHREKLLEYQRMYREKFVRIKDDDKKLEARK